MGLALLGEVLRDPLSYDPETIVFVPINAGEVSASTQVLLVSIATNRGSINSRRGSKPTVRTAPPPVCGRASKRRQPCTVSVFRQRFVGHSRAPTRSRT